MSIESKHPEFLEIADDYRVMRDTFNGERTVKAGGTAYLPATAGQIQDGALKNASSVGSVSYNAYLARAQFPEFISEAINLLVSVMHKEPAVIKLPAALEPMRESATRQGLDISMLLRKINEHQLRFGRFGLLADFPQDPFFAGRAQAPHLVEYEAETIINWDGERLTEFSNAELSFLVMNETVQVRGKDGIEQFEWVEERQFRVAHLSPENPELPLSTSNPLVYSTFTKIDEIASEEIMPQFRGLTLDFIPFVFIGSDDLDFSPNEIPLLGLANLSLAIYRKSADLEQALHILGQDTLVIKGQEVGKDGNSKDESEDTRVGAGAVIRVDEEGDAKFIGINSEGIPEMRTSLESDKSRAQSMGPRLLEARRGQAESGEALRTRVSAQTATLQSIALTGAKGLEKVLKMCAVWIGANPEEVVVTPNLDFTQDTVNASELKALAEATGRKIMLSDKTLHKWLQDRNFTRMTFEEEFALLEQEGNLEPADSGDGTSTSSDDPNDDSMENEDEPASGSGES